MAMIVEDGTGLATADAFISVATAESYLTPRGFTSFAALTAAQKEAAIINASEYVSSAFGWIGARVSQDQALAWPRVSAYPHTMRVPPGVPRAVAIAVARVANAAANGAELFGSVSGGDLLKRVKAGEVEIEYADVAAAVTAAGRASMPWLTDWLGYLITTAPDNAADSNGFGSLAVERV